MTKPTLAFALLGALVALSGCTRLAGTVYDANNRPYSGAIFTVGHPAGVGPYSRHESNAQGKFDFSIVPTDENHVYVYDRKAGPHSAIRLERTEFGPDMRIHLRAVGDMP